MSSSSYINNTRRRSTPSVFIDSISEEDIKLLLSSKTPNIISKRRGSAVSINSITSTTRRNFTKFNDFYFQTSSTSSSLSSQPKHSLSIKENNYHKNNNSSSSISSTSSSTSSLSSSINISSNLHYNTHSEYKHRTKLTSQKLLNFFGAKPPIDICVREIEKEGLKAILNSKIPLFYFLYSLLEEYSPENLFFFLKVEQYESKQYDNSTQQLVMAQQIFDIYLTRNSQFEVNIDDRVRKLTIAAIKSERDLRYCFRDAKQAVFILLESSFCRFIRSDLADTMRKEIGEHTAHYSNEARELSVGWLFKYLEKLGPIDVNGYVTEHFNNLGNNNNNTSCNNSTSTSTNFLVQKFYKSIHSNDHNQSLPSSPTFSISRKRNLMIRDMTLEFIKNLLEIGIEELFYYEFLHNNNSNKSNTHINTNTNYIINTSNQNNISNNTLQNYLTPEIGIKNFPNIIIDNSNNQEFNQVFDYEGWEIDNNNNNSNHYKSNYLGSERNNSNGNINGGGNGKKQELKYKKSAKDLKDHLIRNFGSKKSNLIG
ncbi:6509_t:CDS:2 [Entrophospora sp. SA101]|nr:6509_t:CDS:2 [Entrophospora sp. SA101]